LADGQQMGRQIAGNSIATFGELPQETNCRPGKIFEHQIFVKIEFD
jgi:hypothetical protein